MKLYKFLLPASLAAILLFPACSGVNVSRTNDNGEESGFSVLQDKLPSSWPKDLPNPPGDIFAVAVNNNYPTVTTSGVSADEIREFAILAEDAGYESSSSVEILELATGFTLVKDNISLRVRGGAGAAVFIVSSVSS